MKTRSILLALVSWGLISSGWAQGPLPPPGPPAPTMKTLDQIEPRTAISKLPFTISQPGSYYLTRNLQFTATSGNAITITVSNVSLDLMGFTLSSSAAVTGDAIRLNAGLRNIVVKNGAITGTTTVTISGSFPNQAWAAAKGGFNDGINSFGTPQAISCQFSQLRISGCRDTGLVVGQAVIEQVTSTHNGGSGIAANDGTVSHCSATFNLSAGIVGPLITNCLAKSNGFYGIVQVSGTVENCIADSNGNAGILGLGSNITGCHAGGNESSGIDATTVTNSTAQDNAVDGIKARTVLNSTAVGNRLNGISAGAGSVTGSSAAVNQGDGISAPAGTVTNSNASDNGGNGIYAPDGVIAFCKAAGNNKANSGSVDIFGPTATRTGNKPTP